MQEEVTRAIASEIRVNLSAQEQARWQAHARLTQRLTALSEGPLLLEQAVLEGFQKAIEYFQQATAKDPAYALAYVGLPTPTLFFIFRRGSSAGSYAESEGRSREGARD